MNKNMQQIVALLDRIAPTMAPILFTGERGTGKTYYARYVHEVGAKAAESFFSIETACITPDFLSYVVSQKTETLFLAEISALSIDFQKKILSFVAQFPVRLFASTVYDPEKLVSEGTVLSEFYELFSSLIVHIPSLRSHREDILPLAGFFLEQYGKRLGRNFLGFTHAAADLLQNHYWPGNVAELEEVVSSACYVAARDYIEAVDIRLQNTVISGTFLDTDRSLKTAVDDFKKKYVLSILGETRWNKTQAAKILGLQRTYLSRLIKELKIE